MVLRSLNKIPARIKFDSSFISLPFFLSIYLSIIGGIYRFLASLAYFPFYIFYISGRLYPFISFISKTSFSSSLGSFVFSFLDHDDLIGGASSLL